MCNIIRIIVQTSTIIYGDNTNRYNDLLEIDTKKISYKREYFANQLPPEQWECEFWEYEQLNIDYNKTFNELVKRFDEDVDHMIFLSKLVEITDIPFVVVKLIYDNGIAKDFKTYTELRLPSSGGYVLKLLHDLIPQNYPCSEMLKMKESDVIDLKVLNELIGGLSKDIAFEYTDAPKGSVGFCYPIYPKWLDGIFDLMAPDYQYNKKIKKLKASHKQIKDYSFDDIRVAITYILRQEHFSDCYLPTVIKNGELLELLLRLKETILNS